MITTETLASMRAQALTILSDSTFAGAAQTMADYLLQCLDEIAALQLQIAMTPVTTTRAVITGGNTTNVEVKQ